MIRRSRERGEDDEEPGVVVQMRTRVAPEIRHVPNNMRSGSGESFFIIFNGNRKSINIHVLYILSDPFYHKQ